MDNHRVMRREHSTFAWSLAEAPCETAARFEGQERGRTWDCCVLASNKDGHSGESNILTAVL